jgi:MFS family permease
LVPNDSQLRVRSRTGAGALAGRLPGDAAFWMIGVVCGFVLFAASAPSPLYPVYQAAWHFSAATLTVIFAVYAFALLVALLVAGSISDHVGRRPTLLFALFGEAIATVLFALANGVDWLVVARILQGLATGIATGTLTATLLDLQPRGHAGWAPLTSTVAPSTGLAVGALGAGLAVQYGPAPRHLIFWVLTAIFLLAVLGALLMPETVEFDPAWRRSLRLRVGVPQPARAAFVDIAPIIVAAWALSGLYLSLGASLTETLLHSSNRMVGSLPIVALTGAGTISSVIVRRWSARRSILVGSIILIGGVSGTLAGIAGHQGWLFIAGTAIAGAGFGPAFTGTLRTLSPLVDSHERAGLLAAIYIVCYLAFSIPALVAGVLVERLGLLRTGTGYGIAVIVVATAAVAEFVRSGHGSTPLHPASIPTCAPCPGSIPAFADHHPVAAVAG